MEPLPLAIVLSPEQLELIAERVADLLAERARPTLPDLLTAEEVAQLLRTTRKRVWRMTSDGRLQKVKDGGRVLIPRAEVERHLRGEPAAEHRRAA
jgi:excisionase family DNA binding protein